MNQVGQHGTASGVAEAALQIVQHIDAEQPGGADERMKDVPGGHPGGTAGAKADRPFWGPAGRLTPPGC